MKKTLITLFTLLSINAYAGSAQNIADTFNASNTPAELVKSGWAGNNGGKGYKVLQVIVKDTGKAAELHIDNNGKAAAAFDSAKTAKLNADVDYKMIATMKDWAAMGTGESGPMYHMTFGGLSFEGPMGEAMNNMGPFASFLVNIGKNIQN
ncbi:MAG: SCP2 sterol-binding domain-containing protein [Candidatus Thioglobus sp.]|uniref:SCP2 sterol-binding domain-containing protein n=1 Tax=Candidatus Thioglobus sp. TaxID=2026721 RepID=UPI00261B139C|nr:SCP2 sterol-binding domain-containing protein [Candidatus Thioglobus sp.]MDC9727623.1 SCP2 sterol-binding domain-containing protein [Candidatus Thioglobus sp.]